MSVIKVNSIQHSGAANASIELNANGRVAFSNTVAFTSNNVTIGGQALSPVTGMRNRIINGDMRIDQRNAGASVTPTASAYTLDRWYAGLTQASKYSVQQNAGSVTPPAGFTNYLGITSTSAYSVLSGDAFSIQQRIEGFNVADLGWGTSAAQTVTLSFFVRSSITGNHSGALWNSAFNRSYPFTFAVNSANTWEKNSITIVGDTSGTWLTNNSTGIGLSFNLGAGSSFLGAAGAWGSTGVTGTTGSVSVVGTNGATFYITGVQLEEGSVSTPFERRPYGLELALCQRYFCKSYNVSVVPGTVTVEGAIQIEGATSTYKYQYIPFKVPMRANPTVTTYNPSNGAAGKALVTGSIEITGDTQLIGSEGFIGGMNTTPTNYQWVRFHYTAAIEL